MNNKLPVDEDKDLLMISYMYGYRRGNRQGKLVMSDQVWAIITQWRTEADLLDREAAEFSQSCRDADAARRQAEAKLRRVMATEIERVLEVDHD